jgi:hypothetical protein
MPMFFASWLLTAQLGAPDFLAEVRPLLADRCFACHGPDEAARQAGLRLDTREGALAELASGARALVPGHPEQSELLARIRTHAPEDIMPPPELKRPLSEDERAILERWVTSGAEYKPHWAFVAPVPQALPPVQRARWVRDPLDQFTLARMEQAGLQPEPEASREVWLRRAALVLTGLPPTMEEVDAFLQDRSPEAYERRVDALLASPRAAEHMAVVWLDLARFADTWGYQTDGGMFSWPWRDWLLKALASNIPYDQLITRMIAGDQLPDAGVDERVASAFNRLHRLTEEGGSIPEEFRQEGIADRVATYGTSFLGLSLECARCHDHKYDPIPTREFYGLAALFGKLDENGLKPWAIHTSAPPPFVRLMNADQQKAIEQARKTLAQARIVHRNALAQQAEIEQPVVVPAPVAHYPFETLENNTTPNHCGDQQPASTDRKRPEQLGAVTLGPGQEGQALLLDGDGGLGLTGLSGFTRHDPVTLSMWVRPGELNAKAALIHAAGFYSLDADSSGIELELVDGRLRWSVIHLWPGSAISILMPKALPLGEWTHITATYDGSSQVEGLRVYVQGEQVETQVLRDKLDGPITTHQLELGSRSRGSGFRSGAIDELKVWRRCLTSAQVARAFGLQVPAFELADPPLVEEATQAVRDAERALCAQLDGCSSFLAMEDSAFAPAMHVLKRGAYDQPDLAQPATGGALRAVLNWDGAGPRTRLELARWTCDPRHPLTARVAVNRLWAQVFGRPLVETSENFGWQGAMPTHPELLDMLSSEFVSGPQRWNQHALLRRLVLSATFRQASAASTAKRERDPSNLLLARGPSIRLSAEALRDQALLVSGLLVERLGGPSVKPYEPPGLWNEAGQGGEYTPDSGDNAHRRSLYTFRKRAAPSPNQLIFDAGARESCMPRRSQTNTPLQALVLANDPVYFECAQALARRLATAEGEWSERIRLAYRTVTQREPDSAERAILERLHADQREVLAHDEPACQQLCGSADSDAAAFVIVCSTILCSDAALVLR